GIDDADTATRLTATLAGGEYEALREGLERVFASLDRHAASPSLARRLRKLDVPEKVVLAYAGQTKSGEVTPGPEKHHEFAAPVTDLKESVQFVVRAE